MDSSQIYDDGPLRIYLRLSFAYFLPTSTKIKRNTAARGTLVTPGRRKEHLRRRRGRRNEEYTKEVEERQAKSRMGPGHGPKGSLGCAARANEEVVVSMCVGTRRRAIS